MSDLAGLLKMIAVLVAAVLVGNWFLAEVRQARLERKPWYQPYVSPPGIMILLAILFPILYWIINRI